MEWVRLSRYCELTHETRDSVRNKINKGWWAKGYHYKLLPADNKIWVHLGRVNEWVEQQSGQPE